MQGVKRSTKSCSLLLFSALSLQLSKHTYHTFNTLFSQDKQDDGSLNNQAKHGPPEEVTLILDAPVFLIHIL